MRADIQRYLDGHPVDATTTVVPAAVGAAAVPQAGPTSLFQAPVEDYDDEPRKNKRWPLFVLALVVLALLVGGVVAGVKLFGSGPKPVTVVDVTGQSLRVAQQRLESQGLELGQVDRVNSEDVPKGEVMDQDPGKGVEVDEGTAVDVTVSAGSKTVVITFVIGKTKQEAAQILGDLGLDPRFEDRDSQEPKGTVVATDPNAGESVEAGSSITVFVSTGPTRVPNVVGLSEEAATRKLQAAGFDVESEFDETTPSDFGTVLSQDPDGLSDAPNGSTVTITVSRYKEPSATPTPTPSDTPSDTPSASPTRTPSETPSATPSDGG
jgi:eukaryotic-like serine/threonine-protein kinase